MTGCGCIYIDCDEYADVYRSKVQRARKEHKCDECGRTIVRGEEYEYAVMCVEGSWDKSKTCVDCLSVRKVFFCHGWQFTTLWEYLDEHIQNTNGQISSDCILALTPAARVDVLDRIDRHWSERKI